jgi:hypothetical protein
MFITWCYKDPFIIRHKQMLYHVVTTRYFSFYEEKVISTKTANLSQAILLYKIWGYMNGNMETRSEVRVPKKQEQSEDNTSLGRSQHNTVLKVALVPVHLCHSAVTFHLAPSHTLPWSSPLSPIVYLSASPQQKPMERQGTSKYIAVSCRSVNDI